MKKNEIQNVTENVYNRFSGANVRPFFRGGMPIGTIVNIALGEDGCPIMQDLTFSEGGSTTTYLAFSPCGISVKAFCERGHVLDFDGNDLTEGCADVVQVIGNFVLTWANAFDGDEVPNVIPFQVTHTDEVERYGRSVTLYTYQMVMPE